MKKNHVKIKNLSRDELWNVANSLSLTDMTGLINMFSSSIHVNVGRIAGQSIEVELSDGEVPRAVLNGHSIQLNSNMCELDDMMHDEYISAAVYKYYTSGRKCSKGAKHLHPLCLPSKKGKEG